ncbi:MAG: response regulator [Chloroherpetonaceae bacterium]|nr:response regulator [Chloroherpetonaceae bacterium]
MLVVVDDNEEILHPLAEFLSDIQVTRAFSKPEEALAFVEMNRGLVEVAIVDYAMPTMNGEQVAREIHRIDPNILIIMMSGYVDFERIEPLLKERLIYQFFTKPVDFERLARSVDTAVKLYLRRQAL